VSHADSTRGEGFIGKSVRVFLYITMFFPARDGESLGRVAVDGEEEVQVAVLLRRKMNSSFGCGRPSMIK
jgi:hypothetical protein